MVSTAFIRAKEQLGEPQTIEEFATRLPVMLNSLLTDCRLIGFQWDVSFYESVSNSHDCPHNGDTNFSRVKGQPQGYPGWQGRIWLLYDARPSNFPSNEPRYLRVFTGTGGAGAYKGPWPRGLTAPKRWEAYSWDVRFFEDDWPVPATRPAYGKKRMLAKLGGTTDPLRLRSTYLWQTPEVEERAQLLGI